GEIDGACGIRSSKNKASVLRPASWSLVVMQGILLRGVVQPSCRLSQFPPERSADSVGGGCPHNREGFLAPNTPIKDGRHVEIGRASCRKECRSRWSPYHEKKKSDRSDKELNGKKNMHFT